MNILNRFNKSERYSLLQISTTAFLWTHRQSSFYCFYIWRLSIRVRCRFEQFSKFKCNALSGTRLGSQDKHEQKRNRIFISVLNGSATTTARATLLVVVVAHTTPPAHSTPNPSLSRSRICALLSLQRSSSENKIFVLCCLKFVMRFWFNKGVSVCVFVLLSQWGCLFYIKC